MPRFNGVPVEAQQPSAGGRFGGQLVQEGQSQPAAPRPTGVLGFFAGPAPIQGNTPEERQADYRSRSPALRATVGVGQMVDSYVRGANQLAGTVNPAMEANSRATDELIAGDLPTTVGRVGAEGVALLAPGGAVSKVPTFGGRVAAGSTVGALNAGLQAENAPGDRLQNMAIGAGFGAGGEAAGQAIRAAGRSISPQAKAMLEAAQKRGIKLTPYQLSDSPFLKRLGRLSENLPLTGNRGALRRQQDEFTTAVSRTIGQNADEISPQVFLDAETKIGDQFGELIARNNLGVSDTLLDNLGRIQQEVSELADDGVIRATNSVIDRILNQSKMGVLPGRAYQSIDSLLGKLSRNGGEKGHYAGELRDALRAGMDETISPADREAWSLARQQWRDLKTIEPMVAKSTDGKVSPQALMSRVTADKAGKRQMATGQRGELGELARLGQQMKTPPSPGTAADITAASIFNPMSYLRLAAGIPIGRALNSSLLARLAASETRPAVANRLSRLAGPGAIAARTAVVPADEREGGR